MKDFNVVIYPTSIVQTNLQANCENILCICRRIQWWVNPMYLSLVASTTSYRWRQERRCEYPENPPSLYFDPQNQR